MINTSSSAKSKTTAVRSVKEKLKSLKPDSALITIITRDLLGVFSVPIAIVESLEGIERLMEKSYLKQHLSTSPGPIQAGLSL